MNLKTVPLIVLVLISFLVGCNSAPAPKDELSITKEEICLNYKGTQQCVKTNGTFRLMLKDGKPVLEALDLAKMEVAPSYPQYSRPDAVKAEKLGVIIENKVLSLKNGDRTLRDSTGLGFLIVRDAKGGISCMAGMNAEMRPRALQWDRSDALTGTKVRQMSFSADKANNYMTLSRISFAYGDAANHYIPNDTGTEVVIIDNFKVAGSCNAQTPDECCPNADSPGPDITVTDGMISEYAADGLRLLACFPVNTICTFTDGDKLIVYDCTTQERVCLDYSTCDVFISTSDSGICISVPTSCAIENPFQ
jgi:hypothetical protein